MFGVTSLFIYINYNIKAKSVCVCLCVAADEERIFTIVDTMSLNNWVNFLTNDNNDSDFDGF